MQHAAATLAASPFAPGACYLALVPYTACECCGALEASGSDWCETCAVAAAERLSALAYDEGLEVEPTAELGHAVLYNDDHAVLELLGLHEDGTRQRVLDRRDVSRCVRRAHDELHAPPSAEPASCPRHGGVDCDC